MSSVKRTVTSLIKKTSFELVSYTSARSDMGCQHYEIKLIEYNQIFTFVYSYFIGGKSNLIEDFKSFLTDNEHDPIMGGYNDHCYASALL